MTDRYCNPTLGTDSGPGTSIGAGAWRTINYALSLASASAAGDRILLQSGNYDELIIPEKSGTAGNPITLEAAPSASPVLRGANGIPGIIEIGAGKRYLTLGAGIKYSYAWGAPGGETRFPWIKISGATTHDIIVRDCLIEKPGWEDRAALAASIYKEYGIQHDAAKNVTIDNVTIRGVGIGIQPKGLATGLTISNCDIGHVTYSNIVVADSGGADRGLVIIGNRIHDAALEDGIQFLQDFDTPDDSLDLSNVGTLVLYNKIYANGENAVDLKGAYKVLIEGNAIWGNFGSNNGWHATSGHNTNSYGSINRGAGANSRRVTIRNNIIYNSAAGCYLYKEWKVYSNTFVWNKNTYLGPGTMNTLKSGGVRSVGPGSDIAPRGGIKNNIFIGHEFDIGIYAGNPQPDNETDLDYNLYGSGVWKDITTNGTAITLTEWRNILADNNWRYGKELNSLVVASHAAIKFVNVPANPTGEIDVYDFGLQADSPAVGKGGPLTFAAGDGTNTGALVVEDSTWFSDISGRTDQHVPDRIFFGGQERTVVSVDDDTNTVTVTPNASWIDKTPIFYVRPGDLSSTTPDIGAQNYSLTGGETPPDPPIPGGPGGRAVTRILITPAGGNVNFTFPTPISATPTAWRFTWSYASVDESAVIHSHIGRGWAWNNAGSIVQGAVADMSEDAPALGLSNTVRRSITDGCIVLLVPGATTIDCQVSFVAGTPSGGTVNVVNPPTASFMVTIEAFAPTHAYFALFSIQNALDAATTIPFGFQPNYFEMWTHNRDIPGAAANIQMSMGLATRVGATITQQCMMLRSKDNVAPTSVAGQIRNDYIGANMTDFGGITSGLLLENVTATTGQITTKLAAHPETNPKGFIFAMLFEQNVWSGVVNMPLLPNSAHLIPVGFRPGSADIISTTIPSTNAFEDTGAAGAVGFGCWDGIAQFSTSVADQDGAAVANTQSYIDDVFMNLRKPDGLTALLATVAAQAANLRLNLATVPGTLARQLIVALGVPFVPTVTAEFSATPQAGVGSLTVVFTDLSSSEGTTITEWAWDFGDGNAAATQNATHIYTEPGSYTVTLAVSDGSISNIMVKTDYVVIDEPPTFSSVGYVTAAAKPAAQIASNVFAGAQVG